MSNYSEASFYDNDLITSTEKAVLAEDIKFSKIDILTGKFYIPVLTPEVDMNSGLTNKNCGNYQQSNYVTLDIPVHLLFSFMEPKIERINHTPKTLPEQKHIGDSKNQYCLTFSTNKFTIPKGTIFSIVFIGGELRLDKIVITGVLLTRRENI